MGLKDESDSERDERQRNGAWSDDAILSVARSLMGSITHGQQSPRTRLYLAQLLEGCRGLKVTRPATTLEYVDAIVSDELAKAEEAKPYYDENWRTSTNTTLIPVEVTVE